MLKYLEMLLLHLYLCSILYYVGAKISTTTLSRKDVILSRKRRYLGFPMGSNFQITLSAIKPLMQRQPTGWIILYECDVPWSLPTDVRFNKLVGRTRRSYVDRKEILSKFIDAFSMSNLNSTACIKRIVCELEELYSKGESMLKDILYTIFIYEKNENFNGNLCNENLNEDCPIPFVEYIIRSMTYQKVGK